MPGYILLEGGEEFGGKMAAPDRRALELAGGLNAPLVIIAAAAAPDNNHQRAGRNGEAWFRRLGASQVSRSPVIDADSAALPAAVQELRQAKFIYLLGGFPGHLARSLLDTPAWQAVLEAYADGAVVGGSSAGAMVLGEQIYDPFADELIPGLNLLPRTCLLPHHNTGGKRWAAELLARLPGYTWVGIDERTGLIDDRPQGWTVYGAGSVTVYQGEQVEVYRSGEVAPSWIK